MKKFFSSLFLIVVFAGYAFSRRPSREIVPVPPPVGSSSSSVFVPASSLPDVSSVPPSLPVSSSDPVPTGMYRDGAYTGASADAYYGNVQVKAIVSGGKLSDVQFLDFPHDANHSQRISDFAMPLLKSEAIAAQSAPVDIVSGATEISGAFNQSLASALDQARN